MRALNDATRFLLELAMLAALAYWGWAESDGIWRLLLALAAPLCAAVVWGILLAPRSSRRLDDPGRLVVEVVIFGSGVAALWLADQTVPAAVFGAVVTVHLLLTFALGQR
jgi:hypothetical protein